MIGAPSFLVVNIRAPECWRIILVGNWGVIHWRVIFWKVAPHLPLNRQKQFSSGFWVITAGIDDIVCLGYLRYYLFSHWSAPSTVASRLFCLPGEVPHTYTLDITSFCIEVILIPLALSIKCCTAMPGPNFVPMDPEVPIGFPWWLAVATAAACSADGREGGDAGEEASALCVSICEGFCEGLVGDH